MIVIMQLILLCLTQVLQASTGSERQESRVRRLNVAELRSAGRRFAAQNGMVNPDGSPRRDMVVTVVTPDERVSARLPSAGNRQMPQSLNPDQVVDVADVDNHRDQIAPEETAEGLKR